MSKCKCLTAKGERCSRTAVTADGYCNQHSGKCKKPVTQQAVMKPYQQNLAELMAGLKVDKPKKRVSFDIPQRRQQWEQRRDSLDSDWKSNLQIGTKNGFDVYIIPKGTLLYRGTSIGQPKGRKMKGSALFLGDLPLAAHYAYENNDVLMPSNGKIVEYQTTKDIELLNMNTITTLTQLSKRYNTKRTKEILEQTFGFETRKGKIYRYSDYETDGQLAEWYCSTTGTSGYAIIDPPGFHSEVMLCDHSLVRETGVEYRWIPFYDSKNIYKVSQGTMTGEKLAINGLSYTFDGKQHIMNRFSFIGSELPYIGKNDPYVKPKDVSREAFMESPEIKQALRDYLNKDIIRLYLEEDYPEIYQMLRKTK